MLYSIKQLNAVLKRDHAVDLRCCILDATKAQTVKAEELRDDGYVPEDAELRRVSLSKIRRFNDDFQLNVKSERVAQYRKANYDWCKVPQEDADDDFKHVRLIQVDDVYLIHDGHHRVVGLLADGRKFITARVLK